MSSPQVVISVIAIITVAAIALWVARGRHGSDGADN
jgi:hypothetical protein